MSNCNHKQMYATKAAADEYALFYNSDLLRSETDKLNSYYCDKHRTWHVGHQKSWTQLSKSERINKLLDDGLDRH